MPELLSKHTQMPVDSAQDDAVLEPDRVYIIPSGKNLVLSGGRIKLKTQDRTPGHALNLPIDLFLESLAREFRHRSIAIILSGTGSDGSRGARFVKEAGGVVLAQEPASAKFDGMPRSALMTGLVDKTGTPKWLAGRVSYLTNRGSSQIFGQEDEDEPSDAVSEDCAQEVDGILSLLRMSMHLDLSYLRRRMVERRIRRRMVIQGISSIEDYASMLSKDRAELGSLGRDLLIGVTRFFRDEEAFEALRLKVVPELILSVPTNQPLRLWITACSTGNEVYSLLMLFMEAMRSSGVEREIKVFATDVDEQSLERASRGVYSLSEALDIPMPLLSRYFEQQGNDYAVRTTLREKVIFARHNVVVDPPFTRLNFISCRNLLIYLEGEARKKVLESIVSALRPDNGILFLGSSETPILPESALTCVDTRAKIYRRTKASPRTSHLRHHLSDPRGVKTVSHYRPRPSDTPAQQAAALLRDVLEKTFENEQRSAVIIDENQRLVEVLTDPLSVFRFPKGRPSDDLARICSSSLVAAIATALHGLKSGQEPNDYLALDARPSGGHLRVSIRRLNPETTTSDNNENQQLLLLILRGVEAESSKGAVEAIQPDSAERVAALEAELRQTKESLQATIEELQSSSEEQQSTNEELIASNEELQSTNQELLSVNEELYTVNSEYHNKNQELQLLTADLDNLLNSMDVATLYLDGDLRVRRFTASIQRMLPLQASDHGRPVADIANQLDTDFITNIEQVLETYKPLEREVRDRHKAWVLMRISPYEGPGGRERGVLVTFVDVTRIKNAEETAKVMSERLVDSNRKLTAQSEQLEDLFSIVAHDLKRPVMGLDGAIKIIEASLASSDIDGIHKHIVSAKNACTSLSSMLRDLSDVSKLRQVDAPIEDVDLHRWMKDLLSPFIVLAEQKGVQLGWTSDHGQYRFARSAADGILTNLVENALLHGSTSAEPRIDVSAHVSNDRIRMVVADNGPGIAPQHHERIFELFRRLDPERSSGSGVGLVAARRFAERADGSISVESDVGRGAKFISELPLDAVFDRASAASHCPVLVVDDDTVDAKRVKRLLDNYEVRFARTLDEAFEQLTTRKFGLIVLDLSLPDGHGLQLTSALGSLNRDTPVIVLSSQLDGLTPAALSAAQISAAFSKDDIEAPRFRQAVEVATAS